MENPKVPSHLRLVPDSILELSHTHSVVCNFRPEQRPADRQLMPGMTEEKLRAGKDCDWAIDRPFRSWINGLKSNGPPLPVIALLQNIRGNFPLAVAFELMSVETCAGLRLRYRRTPTLYRWIPNLWASYVLAMGVASTTVKPAFFREGAIHRFRHLVIKHVPLRSSIMLDRKPDIMPSPCPDPPPF